MKLAEGLAGELEVDDRSNRLRSKPLGEAVERTIADYARYRFYEPADFRSISVEILLTARRPVVITCASSLFDGKNVAL